MANQTVRPTSRKEFMNKLIDPYDPKTGNTNQIFSEPAKLGQPEKNRAKEVSLKNDNIRDYKIGIKDFDEALMYYFTNVIKPSVTQNNTKINVPILYGNPENWKSVQLDGYYRDANGKLLAPLIMFKRNTISQNRGLGNKLDGNSSKNIQLFQKSFSKRNIYSNFGVLNNKNPEVEYVASITPDYVTVTYDCVIWTYFIEQMDELVEAINFASRSYWGDPTKFQFYTSIDSFQESVTHEIGEDRAVKNSFTLTLNGYLIPDSINKAMAAANRVYGVSQVIFGLETADSPAQIIATNKKSSMKPIAQIAAQDGNNIVINNITNIGGSTVAIITYLATSISKIANIVTPPNQATITGGTFLQPPADSGLPTTDKTMFSYFINGQYVPVNFVTSFDGSLVVFNVAGLGYDLETDDEVSIIGKFA